MSSNIMAPGPAWPAKFLRGCSAPIGPHFVPYINCALDAAIVSKIISLLF